MGEKVLVLVVFSRAGLPLLLGHPTIVIKQGGPCISSILEGWMHWLMVTHPSIRKGKGVGRGRRG